MNGVLHSVGEIRCLLSDIAKWKTKQNCPESKKFDLQC